MINVSKDTIENLLKESFDSEVLAIADGSDNVTFAKFLGTISQDFIHSLTNEVEAQLLESGVKKSIVKKIFAVLIEGLQNIYNHGSDVDDEGKLGACIVAQTSSHYVIHFMNLADLNNVPKLKTYIDKLNSLDKEETKQLYMETLSNGLLSEKGGAGLGYMTMRLKSLNAIDYQFSDPMNDLCCFQFKVKIDLPE